MKVTMDNYDLVEISDGINTCVLDYSDAVRMAKKIMELKPRFTFPFRLTSVAPDRAQAHDSDVVGDTRAAGEHMTVRRQTITRRTYELRNTTR